MDRDDEHEQSRERFPKTLFALSWCRISKARGFGDLLSRLPVHAGARDGVDYEGSSTRRRGKLLFSIPL